MLEKIGLPPKPSLRGNNWVVDASHCQGCASPFTFINRKHHCRRCGGIFCSSCTQQRMVLRGQGDSPVRICEPCKRLEEAARFEMRQGHKNRSLKGGSKLSSMKEDESLSKLLGNENSAHAKELTESASCSDIQHLVPQIEGVDIVRNSSQPSEALSEVGTATPEDLRQQALIEKGKYRSLKAAGKSEEALKAFKRGKELEKQAGSLEMSLRKNRRKTLSTSNVDAISKKKDDSKAPTEKNNLIGHSKEKADLSAELKELGWSDLDLRNAEKRPEAVTLEGELSSLMREVSQKPNGENRSASTHNSQVIAHKKKALELKRAGNVIEAKEELKRAKVLERKIEEEELLGETEDSDDELSLLMRSVDTDKNDTSLTYNSDLDFNQIVGISDDLGNFEVTDQDMMDPEMASALKSLGWTEETTASENFIDSTAPSNSETLVVDIQSLKREALKQKRAGNTADALSLLKKAKVLEMELQGSEAGTKNTSQSIGEPLFTEVEPVVAPIANKRQEIAPKSKLMVQKELIALKKNALSLRREGRLDESEEELKRAKVLEDQLEAMNNSVSSTPRNMESKQTYKNAIIIPDNDDEEEVTDQDLNDPSYLSLLKNMGWEDEDGLNVPSNDESSKPVTSSKVKPSSDIEATRPKKSKAEIQRELLALKRKALTLRRQGQVDEAEEVLKTTKLLEAQLQDCDEPRPQAVSLENSNGNASNDSLQKTLPSVHADILENKIDLGGDSLQKTLPSVHTDVDENKMDLDGNVKKIEGSRKEENVVIDQSKERLTETAGMQPNISPLREEILAHKRKAVLLKREGNLVDAREELRQAKVLEKCMEEASQGKTNLSNSSTETSPEKGTEPSSSIKPLSSRDRFKMQQESLNHKRTALKLRREGKTEEADAEFELAKALESKLQESESHNSSKSSEPADDVSIEDFLDPQLLSALHSIGLDDIRSTSHAVDKPEPIKLKVDSIDSVDAERNRLMEKLKAEKVRALNLKRSGKQAEALDALRQAKLYEKKLQSLTTN